MEAEQVLKKRLAKLDDPNVHPSCLENIQFTLDICERILPQDADPIHYSRLSNLGMRIYFALD